MDIIPLVKLRISAQASVSLLGPNFTLFFKITNTTLNIGTDRDIREFFLDCRVQEEGFRGNGYPIIQIICAGIKIKQIVQY